MTAYYNEIDKGAARWLEKLIAKGLIAKGDVDTRSILDVHPEDLNGYEQLHFFAGIGGWSRALRLAGWSDDRPVTTGSCPCQPFSSAGKGGGVSDPRHLWPAFRWLIAKRKPSIVFGEQVASSAGREWIDGVRADLEAMGYAAGAADLCAACVGSPQVRQRLFWVANANNNGLNNNRIAGGIEKRHATTWCDPLLPWPVTKCVVCRDGKKRRIPVEPALYPVAHGVPGRVGLLRGAGNAIVPQVAAMFIKATA